MTWPPRVGESLPNAVEAFGIHRKLADYSLNPRHEDGGPKALGFRQILGITLDDLDYLARSIQIGILKERVKSVRPNSPFGINCVVAVPIRGLREKESRIVDVRTVWEIAVLDAPPLLISAFPSP